MTNGSGGSGAAMAAAAAVKSKARAKTAHSSLFAALAAFDAFATLDALDAFDTLDALAVLAVLAAYLKFSRAPCIFRILPSPFQFYSHKATIKIRQIMQTLPDRTNYIINKVEYIVIIFHKTVNI
jgi:hypothetical protein